MLLSARGYGNVIGWVSARNICNSIAIALELHPSYTNPMDMLLFNICKHLYKLHKDNDCVCRYLSP